MLLPTVQEPKTARKTCALSASRSHYTNARRAHVAACFHFHSTLGHVSHVMYFLCACVCAACGVENKDCFAKPVVLWLLIFVRHSEASLACTSNSKVLVLATKIL